MHYSSDESIPESDAFNSEDEAKYGQYFQGKSYSYSSGKVNGVQLLAVEVNATKTQGDADVVTVEVLEGTKAVLSSVCVDGCSVEQPQLRLMFRCKYEIENQDAMPWMCLCSFFGSPNTPWTTSLNKLEVVGPSVIEFKTLSNSLNTQAWSTNIFGHIVPTDAISSGMVYVNKNTHSSGNVSLKESSKAKTSATSKRKLSHEAVEDTAKGGYTHGPKSPDDASKDGNKLTKKQRKVLAEEKTKQLEEALTAARDTNSETKSKKKKKKKKQSTTSEDEPFSKPTSLTHERRLPGGILISDILIGTGTKVSSGRKISLHYTGKLTNGKVFDKNHSRTQPLQFRQGTGEVIRGLERGLEGMKVGGERTITVPSALGYGEKGAGVEIPPDSDLVFEVKVLKVG